MRIHSFAALFALCLLTFAPNTLLGQSTQSETELRSVVVSRTQAPGESNVLPAGLAEQLRESGGGDCATSEVILNTGYDHIGGAALPLNVPDPRWQVLVDTDPNTAEPRPASTIQKNPAWQNPEPDSQWIGTYPGNAQTVNGDYVFETVFCLREDAQAVLLEIGMRSDDECEAYLNEPLADIVAGTATPFFIGQDFNDPDLNVGTFTFDQVQPGKNRLTVKVRNIGSVAMGLNVVAKITSIPGGTAERPECCCPFGVIQGVKFNDLDGDGVRDPGEPTMSGWTINLVGATHTDSVVTDGAGFFNFVNVPPGSYTISEVQQPGWVQTAPAAGTFLVNVNPLEAIGGLEFGNREGCSEFMDSQVLCEVVDGEVTGDFILTGTLTNLQDIPVQYVMLPQNATSPAGVELCFGTGSNVMSLSPPLNNGDSFGFGATGNDDAIIIKNAQPGDEVCFTMVLADQRFEECCTVEVCVRMPPCDCLQIDKRRTRITDVICNSDGTVDFTYTFELTNLFGQDVEHAFMIPNGSESFTPDYFDLVALNGGPLANGQSMFLTTTVTGATPGMPVSFLMVIHTADFEDCCARDHVVIAPQCDGSGRRFTPSQFRDISGEHIEGDLGSLQNLDQDELCYEASAGVAVLGNGRIDSKKQRPQNLVWLSFTGEIVDTGATMMEFSVESSADTAGLTMIAEVWDHANGAWVSLGSRPESFNATEVAAFTVPGPLQDYILPDSEEVRTRVAWKPGNLVSAQDWKVTIDRVCWTTN